MRFCNGPYRTVYDFMLEHLPEGQGRPMWNKNGKELFFLGDVVGGIHFSLMSAPIQTTSTFSAGNPVKLFEGSYFAGSFRPYDVAADGRRFLMLKIPPVPESPPDATPASLVVVLNWTEELKRLVPARK